MEIHFDSAGNTILDQSSEDNFVDLTFRITNLTQDAQHYHFHLIASHANETVGMNVIMIRDVQGGFDGEMKLVTQNVYPRGVRFLRSGPESDRLMTAISELYGESGAPQQMVDEESFTAIALHQGHLDIAKEPVRLKLFGKDDEWFDEEEYYESFFNVDIPNGFVFWNEKDSDCRKALLQGLSRG